MKRDERSFLFVLIERTVVFFFFMTVILLILYLMGNYQEYLDSTQILLINLLIVITLFEVIMVIYYLGFLVFYAVKFSRIYTIRIIFASFSLLMCGILGTLVMFLNSWFVF